MPFEGREDDTGDNPPAEIAGWNIDVDRYGNNLPPGSRSVSHGRDSARILSLHPADELQGPFRRSLSLPWNAASSGLFALNREISVSAGRTRTS